jgi:ABC-type polysaccharide/polyol phosphate transport system ATPase subunit
MAKVILENVRVDFPIYGAQQRSLRTAIVQRATGGLIHREGRHKERVVVRALSNVSLQLEEGDRLGLIGHNGSGKSTLLKVIAGIYEPIAGTRMVEGRVTPLFDMMPGLDPEDTGYENILTSGMLLGMSRDQVESKIPEIEKFSELGEYLALPMRTYSAGMTMRLGFALATALEPGVLLMDEGFGTTDLRFTERAAQRMSEFIGRSRIVVLATHSDGTIKSMCNKAALMHEGQLHAIGLVDNIIEQYRSMMGAAAGRKSRNSNATASVAHPTEIAPERPVYSEDSISEVGLVDRLARTNGAVRFNRAVARDENGNPRWTYQPGETVTFRFEYEVLQAVPNLALLFRLYLPSVGHKSQNIVTDISEVLSADALEAGIAGEVELTLPRLALMPNRLSVYVWLGRADVSWMKAGKQFGYDVIDTNIDLPPLTIAPEPEQTELLGITFVEHELRNIEWKNRSPALVT